jgi:hypothetical protein
MEPYRKYDWPALFLAFEQSGLTQTQFCFEQSLNPEYFSQKRKAALRESNSVTASCSTIRASARLCCLKFFHDIVIFSMLIYSSSYPTQSIFSEVSCKGLIILKIITLSRTNKRFVIVIADLIGLPLAL